MKKALACTLSLALLLSLTACNKPQAEQQDNSQPDNSAATSTQADVSIPEPDNTPAPEPPKAPVPEQLSDTVPAAPAENEDPQDQTEPATQEPAAQEPAETEPVKTETPKQTAPKTTDNPPAETTPAEQAQEPQTQQQSQEQQSSGLTPEMEEHNRKMLEQKQQEEQENKQDKSGQYQSTRKMTDEEAQRRVNASAEIAQGKGQLQYDPEIGYYYVY